MNHKTVGAVVVFASGLILAQTKPAVELEGAIAKEQVSGDLKAAISAYQKIGAENSAPRDVRAKALLHLAGCYERLGQQESRKVYEQIVREFADQPSAVQARARLSALKQIDHLATTVSMTQRQIEPLGDRLSPRSAYSDGYRAVYVSSPDDELIYADLASHKKRIIFKAKVDEPVFFSLPSRDFSKVLLGFFDNNFAVINTGDASYRKLPPLDIDPGRAMWSWDNRYILLCGQSPDGMGRLLRINRFEWQSVGVGESQHRASN